MSNIQANDWARICRIEAARTTHGPTRDFLLELADEYEGINGEAVLLDPDDPGVQDSVADRLLAYAAQRRALDKR